MSAVLLVEKNYKISLPAPVRTNAQQQQQQAHMLNRLRFWLLDIRCILG
jgi:hypothetical protein